MPSTLVSVPALAGQFDANGVSLMVNEKVIALNGVLYVWHVGQHPSCRVDTVSYGAIVME
ncbi:hypothetical protein PsorP6_010937 [Peronosclerospora sorghi]|uniref:Uncharacterized protein n=1 Tax=Peronosclerospora sorghi TaxID=230839 RepID=A0ACC0VXP6_9STRA|nr:hypothetical protein PsorP6_010937 [Peronosclerospora sorghi]